MTNIGCHPMGEIKSTLDLVMERTRHLSLSKEEKQQQQHAEFEKRLAGLLQQYADQRLSVETFFKGIAQLEQETNITDQKMVYRAVLNRIVPDQDNREWILLADKLNPSIGRELEKQLAAYTLRKNEILEDGRKRLQEHLTQNHGISGSAVVANPNKDAFCRQELAALRKETQDHLTAASPA